MCAAAYGRVQTPCKAAGVPGRGAAGVSPIIKGETTEEREMRLAAKAKERLKKVGRRVSDQSDADQSRLAACVRAFMVVKLLAARQCQ